MFYATQGLFGVTTSDMFVCQGSSGHEAVILLALEQLYYRRYSLANARERYIRSRIFLRGLLWKSRIKL